MADSPPRRRGRASRAATAVSSVSMSNGESSSNSSRQYPSLRQASSLTSRNCPVEPSWRNSSRNTASLLELNSVRYFFGCLYRLPGSLTGGYVNDHGYSLNG